MSAFNFNQYLFFEKYAASIATKGLFSNPGLKPEREVNYEITFKQEISKNLGLVFGAFYSERRDQVVAYQYSQAYPESYMSYTNMDFGTTQGFSLELMMRAEKHISFNANYTLMFARGTGSDANSTINLLRSGSPNMRFLSTLDDDQRHKINFEVSYRLGKNEGLKSQRVDKKTNTVKEIHWLQYTTITLGVGAGSGFPYTRSSVWHSNVVGVGDRVVVGSINGSRMPWVLTSDLSIQKGFPLALKKKEDGKIEKSGTLFVGLGISNLLGYRNVKTVYDYSGDPVDDGFLTAREFQQYIASRENPESFIDYYSIMMRGNNSDRLGSPRTFVLQLSFTF